MLNEYLEEYNSNKLDHIYIYDYKILHDIEFSECTTIIRLVKNDWKIRFNNFDINKLPYNDVLEYDINNSFFSKLTIILKCMDDETYVERPSQFLSYENSNVTILQLTENPLSIDFSLLRYSLLIAYYKYLTINNADHIFVKFINFINIKHLNSISEQIFENIHNNNHQIFVGSTYDIFR